VPVSFTPGANGLKLLLQEYTRSGTSCSLIVDRAASWQIHVDGTIALHYTIGVLL
jgi:hypothetical protein